jgi:hypothetical protein
MKRIGIVLALLGAVGCKTSVPPAVVQEYQSRTLFTCCNIHYETDEITDANYFIGSTIPVGTPVQIQAMRSDSVTFTAGGTTVTLYQSYGTAQESFQQYLNKVLVPVDPKDQLAGYPTAVQEAIRDGRVERGMSKDQVLMSLGYPPTHRTASTASNDWVYWYNRFVTYRVQFDPAGRVSNVVGRPAPTRDQPVS